ncbi:unnamed protein product, partial [Ectocarpus sp. 6 AP-2014]
AGDSHGNRGVQRRQRSSQQDKDVRHRRGSAETSLAAGGAPPTDSEQEQQGLEKKRKLNPLETLLMVYTQTSARKDARSDRQYPFFTGLPLKPYFDRPTVRTEEIPGVMWAFEQPQEFFNVSVNIRMTAVRLEGGGLWVHAPVAPTEECVNLVEELGEEVRYIVLPTTAFEHKVYVKPFSDRFPRAQVYACPGQWSWPINLPPSFRVDGVLCEGERAPWEDEVECKLFSPPIGGVGPSNEVIFFHKATKTLLVTDCVICIPRDPPAIIGVEGLLQAAADEGEEPRPDSPENRRQGWAKMCLQVLFLGPALPSTFGVVSEKLVVSPVLRTLTLKRVQPYVKEFASEVCRDWPDIKGFLACHYSRRVPATTGDFRRAFGFAFANVDGGKKGSPPAAGSGPAGEKKQAFGDAGGFLKSLGLDRLLKAG